MIFSILDSIISLSSKFWDLRNSKTFNGLDWVFFWFNVPTLIEGPNQKSPLSNEFVPFIILRRVDLPTPFLPTSAILSFL